MEKGTSQALKEVVCRGASTASTTTSGPQRPWISSAKDMVFVYEKPLNTYYMFHQFKMETAYLPAWIPLVLPTS